MGVEREKKYAISADEAKKLVKKSLFKIGVVQWYLDNCNVFGKNENCRVRYTVDENGNEEWIVAYKGKLKEDFTRLEEEYRIIPSNELLQVLVAKPTVAKIRYFLLYDKSKDTEVVLDEFIELDHPYNVAVQYLAEIETTEDFKIYENIFNLKKPLSFEEFKKFENSSIAVPSNLSLNEIIELVKEKLKEI